jgi:DNA-binding transcriptional LysR family regulator
VLLTEAGQLLREHCEKIFRMSAMLRCPFGNWPGMQRGKLRLGTGATTLIYQLPPVLEAIRRASRRSN